MRCSLARCVERGSDLSARRRHVHLEVASELIEALFSRQLLFLFWRQQPVISFEHDGVAHAVLAFAAPRRA